MRIALIAILSAHFLFASDITLERRVELLESAVVKLIKERNENREAIERNAMAIKALKALNNKREKSVARVNLGRFAIIKATLLNIRKAPHTKSKIIGKYRLGEIVKVLKFVRNKKNQLWLKTDRGYISSYYTDIFSKEIK